MRGMYDEKHYNCWENWFKKAFGVEEFSTFNTLWLTYFISGGSISYTDQRFAFKKILQTVYTSLPDLIGVLFLVRKYLFLAVSTHASLTVLYNGDFHPLSTGRYFNYYIVI